MEAVRRRLRRGADRDRGGVWLRLRLGAHLGGAGRRVRGGARLVDAGAVVVWALSISDPGSYLATL